MTFTLIRQFNTVADAYIYRMLLEKENIPCYLNDEYVSNIQPLYSYAIGGVKLHVPTEYAEQAIAIVESFEATPLTNEENEVITCAKCGSDRIESGYRSNKNLKNFLAIVICLFTIPYPIYSKYVYKCKSCGKEFES